MDQGGQGEVSFTIDASVCARWLIPGEEHEARAMKARDEYAEGLIELNAPHLLTFEVLNALWKSVEGDHMKAEDAISMCRAFAKITPKPVDFGQGNLEEVLEIAVRDHITCYDASYIVAARKTVSTLITADNALYSAAKGRVKATHLRDY